MLKPQTTPSPAPSGSLSHPDGGHDNNGTTTAHTHAKLWGGRFSSAVDPLMEQFNASIGFDKAMYAQVGIPYIDRSVVHLPAACCLCECVSNGAGLSY